MIIKNMALLAVLFTVTTGTSAMAEEKSKPSTIVKYMAKKLELFDDKQEFTRRIDRKDLPKVPVTILQLDAENDMVQIELGDGQQVWLDKYYLKLNITSEVKYKCLLPAKEKEKSDATIGFGDCK